MKNLVGTLLYDLMMCIYYAKKPWNVKQSDLLTLGESMLVVIPVTCI